MFDIAIAFVFCGVAYWVASIQAFKGYWPFFRRYRVSIREQDIAEEKLQMIVVPHFFGAIAFLLVCVVTGISLFIVGVGLSLGLCCIRILAMEGRRENAPIPGFFAYLPGSIQKAFETRPMLAFDAWTLGITAMVAFICLLFSI